MLDNHAIIILRIFLNVWVVKMTENNKKQALVLEGDVLENQTWYGTWYVTNYRKHSYMFLPGPPKEMEPMFQFEAKPLA